MFNLCVRKFPFQIPLNLTEVVAGFERTLYTLKEGDGEGAVTVSLSKEAEVDVKVRIVGSEETTFLLLQK